MNDSGKLILYRSKDGAVQLDAQLDKETIWLSQKQMAQLFGKDTDTIGLHIHNVYKESELEESATTEDSSVVRTEGKMKQRPFSKNPTISKFMTQIGRSEELGSVVRNIYKYLPFYSHGAKPVFLEQIDSFELIIPLAEMKKAQVEPQVILEVKKMLRILEGEMTIPDKPSSRLQKYRITEKGKKLIEDKNEQG